MNKVILTGNLTRDPEITTTNSGVSVCRFSIAVQRPFQNADGEREADFFNIVVWRGRADTCYKFLKKGSKVAVVGRIQNSNYEASDGTKRYSTEIVADDVEFLSARAEGDTPRAVPTPAPAKKGSELKQIDDDDTLPF